MNDEPIGEVCSDRLYTLSRIQKVLGVGPAGFRTLKDAGLPVVRIGKKSYVVGEYVIAFFKSLSPSGKAG